MNRGVLIGMVIAAAIFPAIYLVITANQGSIESGDWVVAIVGAVICAAVAAVIGTLAAKRATR